MAHDKKLTPPRDFEVPATFNTVTIAMVVVGVLAFGAGFAVDAHAAWNGYLIGFWFTLSLALSGPFIASTQYLSIAGWSATIRRVVFAYGVYLLPALVFGIVGLLGGSVLYEWYDAELVHNDYILKKKAGFLNPAAFGISTVAILIALIGVSTWQRRVDYAQDEDGDYAHTNTAKGVAALFLFTFVVGFSFLAWYWIMGLQPHWFSTMFSVYLFAGMFQSGLALTILIVLWMRDRGDFGDYLGERQIHDLGQLLFGFTVFYAYIGFSQFLLIWYANIPEEALWYVTRGTPPDISTGWDAFSLILPIAKFILPFFILLPQAHKKNKNNILRFVAAWLMFMQLYEVWYWVAPTPHHGVEGWATAPSVVHALIEFGVAIGFIGLFLNVVFRHLTKHPVIPVKDPFLHEAVKGHHHGTAPPKPAEIKIS